MADGRVGENSDKILSIERDCFDFNKISEYILHNVEEYCLRWKKVELKWCDEFELLKEFIESVFCQQGRWWLAGGSSKRFYSSSSEFAVMW